jgi:hypothetical protein
MIQIIYTNTVLWIEDGQAEFRHNMKRSEILMLMQTRSKFNFAGMEPFNFLLKLVMDLTRINQKELKTTPLVTLQYRKQNQNK